MLTLKECDDRAFLITFALEQKIDYKCVSLQGVPKSQIEGLCGFLENEACLATLEGVSKEEATACVNYLKKNS